MPACRDDGEDGIWADHAPSMTDTEVLLLTGSSTSIFDADILLIPVLVSARGSGPLDHWVLIAVHHTENFIEVLDTLAEVSTQHVSPSRMLYSGTAVCLQPTQLLPRCGSAQFDV